MNTAKEIRRIYYNIICKLKNKHIKNEWGARLLPGARFEGHNKIGENTVFGGEMGKCSYIGKDGYIIGKVGRFCSIGDNVRIYAALHPVSDAISTSPAIYSTKKQCGKSYVKKNMKQEFAHIEGSKYALHIGNDVHIGSGVSFVGSITVGDGAIVGANATVTKDVLPYEVVAGVPAKTIKKRFTDKQIEFLVDFKWWEKSDQWIEENAELLCVTDKFFEKYGDKI